MQRHAHTAQERVNTAGLRSSSSAEPICRVGPWLAAGNLADFYPTWSAEHLLSFLKSGISVCVAGRCSYITSKISVKILHSEGQTGSPGLHAFLHFAAGLRMHSVWPLSVHAAGVQVEGNTGNLCLDSSRLSLTHPFSCWLC